MSFRQARRSDTRQLYEWRLQDEAQRWYEGRSITYETHARWVEQRLRNPLVRILIWEDDNTPTGMVRIDSNGELTFHARDDATAIRMLKATRVYANENGGRLKATLDTSNIHARKLLARAGFQEYQTTFLAYKP